MDWKRNQVAHSSVSSQQQAPVSLKDGKSQSAPDQAGHLYTIAVPKYIARSSLPEPLQAILWLGKASA